MSQTRIAIEAHVAAAAGNHNGMRRRNKEVRSEGWAGRTRDRSCSSFKMKREGVFFFRPSVLFKCSLFFLQLEVT